jgi:hypothetical protein
MPRGTFSDRSACLIDRPYCKGLTVHPEEWGLTKRAGSRSTAVQFPRMLVHDGNGVKKHEEFWDGSKSALD